MTSGKDKIFSIFFNNSQDCFVLGCEEGIRICQSRPILELRHIPATIVGSVKIARMLNRTNIIGFVSGGKRPFASDNTALIWDDENRCLITEIIVGSTIHNFFLSYTKLVTVEKNYISIFSYPSKLEKLREEKIQGLSSNVIAVCPDQKSEIMVYPGLIVGTISILNLLKTEKNSATVPIIVSAHKHPLVVVALNKDGTLVSTGSTMGTLVKVFSTRSGDQMAELRRGLDNVTLRCLCFSLCGNYVLASSNKETAHIFCLESKPHDNQKSIKDLVPLINKNEKRSVLKVELPSGQGDAECAFVPSSVPHASHKLGRPNTCPYDILSISKQGCLSRFSGNDATINLHGTILNIGDDQSFWTAPI